MVVFVDLDEGSLGHDGKDFRHVYPLDHSHGQPYHHYADQTPYPTRSLREGAAGVTKSSVSSLSSDATYPASSYEISKQTAVQEDTESSERSKANRDHLFAAALGCYPVVSSLTQWLDLNTLYSLSLTCQQFRANLLQFRSQLVRQTLRCESEAVPLASELLESPVLPEVHQRLLQIYNPSFRVPPRIGKCARDLVGECRRCGRTICRNCTIKPPAGPMLRDRHRRLCVTCQHAPLKHHTVGPPPSRRGSHESDYHQTQHQRSSSPQPSSSKQEEPEETFTTPAFSRGPCTCESAGVFLCQPCGMNLRSSDITYKRVWTWRSRYSTHIGGLGTGMGEGNQGQKCGRGEQCLAARDAEVEIDCSSADEFDDLVRQQSHASISSSVSSASSLESSTESQSSSISSGFLQPSERKTSYEHEPGYFRQEIEGIGGVVKKKVKKRVRIGSTVAEYDDEKESAKYLEREASGRERSWCGWCCRVVEGQEDLHLKENEDDGSYDIGDDTRVQTRSFTQLQQLGRPRPFKPSYPVKG